MRSWFVVVWVALASGGCKGSDSGPVQVHPGPAVAASQMDKPAVMPKTVVESCGLICDRSTWCLGVPEMAAQCSETCVAQAPEPEQKALLLATHRDLIEACFDGPCVAFDGCFKRVMSEAIAKQAKAAGIDESQVTITPEAEASFKTLFCDVAKEAGDTLPNLEDPNASDNVKKLRKWMEMLATTAPTRMQTLLAEAEKECALR